MHTYLLNLVFHCFDVIFTRFNLFFQLLDLVIKNKFELLQLLVFLFQIIYSPFLNANRIDLKMLGNFKVHACLLC